MIKIVSPQVIRPADICTDDLSGKSQVDNNNERAWPATTTTAPAATTTTTTTTKACAEESTGVVAPMKQRKFSFKHGKVSTTDEDEDDAHGDGDDEGGDNNLNELKKL